jgi:hypothetical protein
VARLVAYLVGVGAMGMIAQAAVGSALHDVVWATRERTVPGEARVVTETTPGLTVTTPAPPTTVAGQTVTRPNAPRETVVAPTTTTLVTVPGPTTTTTVPGPAVTTTVSGKTETVPVPGPTVTTTVPGPAVTTTVAGPAVTTTVPGPTETVTVTVETACDPPPKKPSDPPCPPHK